MASYPVHIYFETELEPSGARPRKNRLLGLWDEHGFEGCVRAESRDEADWCLLASPWNDFVDAGEMDKLEALNDALRGGPRLLVWAWGDEEVVNPFDNTVVLQSGTSRRRLNANIREVPYPVGDPVEAWFGGPWHPAPVYSLPTVAFCGRGVYRPMARAKSKLLALTSRHHARYRFFRPADDEYMVLRGRVLAHLENSTQVVADIHTFDHFGGGIHTDPGQTELKAKVRFINNLRANVYGLCVRGAGNFSTRFYECLACGRIPVLIDTDTVLPEVGDIDWGRTVILVGAEDRDRIDERVASFHEALGPEGLVARQAECRRLWLDHLSERGFARDLTGYLH